MVEGARLESVYAGNRIAGSNPAPSAIIKEDYLGSSWPKCLKLHTTQKYNLKFFLHSHFFSHNYGTSRGPYISPPKLEGLFGEEKELFH